MAALAIAGGAAHKTVTVPNVIGMRGFVAGQTLERAGLRWQWGDGSAPNPLNGFFLRDRIYGQTFVGQRVAPGTTILLVPGSSKILDITDLP